ncbi:hypothetical protein PR048_017512 [Dryococelus australis]|uniref:Uncharacterized protein n=1 Tax=Dryococelus australis TaxID=614101 RepID=A0ABQ9H9T0_9NEOP|nr:hypothetical protein PR048_017512 [Dryococelus australis]
MLKYMREHDTLLKEHSKQTYDKGHGVKDLEPLALSAQVWVLGLKRSKASQISQIILLITRLSNITRHIVKVPGKEGGTAAPASSTTEDNTSATARPSEARGMTIQTFNQDTLAKDSLEGSSF